MRKEFILVVMDHDKKTFSVEGPMEDDTRWVEAIIAAKDAGRNVGCTTSDGILTPDAVAAQVRSEFRGFTQAARRSIVAPSLF